MNVTTMKSLLEGAGYAKDVRLFRARNNMGDPEGEVRTPDELARMGKLGLLVWGVAPDGKA